MTLPRWPIAALTVSALAISGIALHEGYRERAYDDGVGRLTIGFGSTTQADGRAVAPADRTTPERALRRLAEHATDTERALRACLPGDLALAAHEWDAYVSLAYNIGPSAFCGSTLARKLRQSPPDYAGACREILRWTRAGGRELAGLKRRRQAEYEQCRGGA